LGKSNAPSRGAIVRIAGVSPNEIRAAEPKTIKYVIVRLITLWLAQDQPVYRLFALHK